MYKRQVLNLLKKINLEQKTTFLIVTHDADIAEMCDRILQMEDGLIVNNGTTAEEE